LDDRFSSFATGEEIQELAPQDPGLQQFLRMHIPENKLYYGDNLDVMSRHMANDSVDLIYLDPPFQSGRNYNVFFRNEAGMGSQEQIRAFKDTWRWGPEAEENLDRVMTTGGDLAQALVSLRALLGTCDLLAYLAMMAPRINELLRVLRPQGTLYLHCDPHASHYLKLLLDACFGGECFRNEIIWRYRRMPAKSRDFQRVHDVILRYTKDRSGQATFNIQYDKLAPSTLETWGTRKQNAVYVDGKRVRSSSLDEESLGVPMGDVWEIPIIAPIAKERLGYPTQKPEALLERIIRTSSNEGDVVFDPFCGCGTAVAVAQRLGRKWTGIDITHLAIGLIKYRVDEAFGRTVNYTVVGEPTTVEGARQLAAENPYQFQWWFVGKLLGRPVEQQKGRDQGVDGRLYFRDQPDAGIKQVVLSVKAGKVLPAHVRDLRGVLEREASAGAVIGGLLSLHAPSPEMIKEAASAGFYKSPWGSKHPRLQLLTAEQLLKGQGLNYPSPSQTNVSLLRAQKPGAHPVQGELPGIAKAKSSRGAPRRIRRSGVA